MYSLKVSPTDLHRFIYKCHTCMLGFKRRGMLVNHLAKRHPEVAPTTVPELNLPILKTTKDFYCQYCEKVYKSSSKRKSHIIKNHPGAALPAGAREVNRGKSDKTSSYFCECKMTVNSRNKWCWSLNIFTHCWKCNHSASQLWTLPQAICKQGKIAPAHEKKAQRSSSTKH